MTSKKVNVIILEGVKIILVKQDDQPYEVREMNSDMLHILMFLLTG